MNLLSLLKLILGEAESIIPIFIHNPKSQQIEGVVVGTVNGVLGALGTGSTPPTPPAA